VGQFKIGVDKDRMKIKGEQYATIEKPVVVFLPAVLKENLSHVNELS